MNDFTKEELDILNTALSMLEKRLYGNKSPTKYTDLLKKIGQLSDNYCDHIFTDGSGNFVTCFNCQQTFGRR